MTTFAYCSPSFFLFYGGIPWSPGGFGPVQQVQQVSGLRLRRRKRQPHLNIKLYIFENQVAKPKAPNYQISLFE
jgi:hypothetical protein